MQQNLNLSTVWILNSFCTWCASILADFVRARLFFAGKQRGLAVACSVGEVFHVLRPVIYLLLWCATIYYRGILIFIMAGELAGEQFW